MYFLVYWFLLRQVLAWFWDIKGTDFSEHSWKNFKEYLKGYLERELLKRSLRMVLRKSETKN